MTKKTGIVISRWASDVETLRKIGAQQQETINPDAIFGRIDPRDANTVELKEMIAAKLPSQKHSYNKARGSSAR